MILGQLIQTGRRFCECRSREFIPKTEDRIVVISYCIHDQILAHAFDAADGNLQRNIRAKLQQHEAVAYLLIQRFNHRFQTEFPEPIGRKPMDRVVLTAATKRERYTESYYLENVSSAAAYRLIPTSLSNKKSVAHKANLFDFPTQSEDKSVHYLFPELTEVAG